MLRDRPPASPEGHTNPQALEDLGIEMLPVPAGRFTMGEPPGSSGVTGAEASGGTPADVVPRRAVPEREVLLAEFRISRHPVTAGQYHVFCHSTGYPLPHEQHPRPPYGEDASCLPVVFIPWRGAVAFCRWLSLLSGHQVRLPTEAQWEKAARGTDARPYPWGDEPPMEPAPAMEPGRDGFVPTTPWGETQRPMLWRCNCAGVVGGPTPVDAYPLGASPCGCLDMAGNVWEWCEDWFDPHYYRTAPDADPPGPPTGRNKVIRGGAYDSPPDMIRCTTRCYDRAEGTPFFPTGFRITTD